MPEPGVPPVIAAGSSECWPQWFFVPSILISLVIGLSSFVFENSAGLGSHQSSSGASS